LNSYKQEKYPNLFDIRQKERYKMCFEKLKSIHISVKCRNEDCEVEFDMKLDLSKEKQAFSCPECNLNHYISYPRILPHIFKITAEEEVREKQEECLTTSISESDYLAPIPYSKEGFVSATTNIMEESIIGYAKINMKTIIIMGAGQDKDFWQEREEVKKFLKQQNFNIWYIEDILNKLKSEDELNPQLTELKNDIGNLDDDLETLEKKVCLNNLIDLVLILQHSHGASKEFEDLVKDPNIAPKIRLFIPEKYIPIGGIHLKADSYDCAGPLTRFFRFFPNSIFSYRNIVELKSLVWYTITEYLKFFYF